MTDYDINEIADARFMGLMCPPASPEAMPEAMHDIVTTDDGLHPFVQRSTS
jgi:hypothetical protein